MEQQTAYEDEINLGIYIETLFRQWRLILIITLIFIIAGYLSTSTKTKIYQASALVATTRSSSEVSFGSSIDTVTEANLNAYRYVDRKARMNSFVELVKNPLIAEAVIAELDDQLIGNQQDLNTLITSASGTLVNGTDTISIEITNSDPLLASKIANSWANAYVEQINSLYSEGETNTSYLAVQAQVAEAKTTYDAAQEEFVEFERKNRIAELTRQGNDLTTLIENLSTARNDAFNFYITDLTSKLDQAFNEGRRVDKLILDAQGMLNQVKSGGSSANESNVLALMLLKNQAFAANESSTNLTIQTIPVTMTIQSMVDDINGLISALQDRREELDQEIVSLSDQLLVIEFSDQESVLGSGINDNNLEQYINDLEAEVRIIQAELAEEQDRQRELNRASELAWETYQNLATKAAELGVAGENIGTEVVLALPASIPSTSQSNVKRMILFSAAAGFITGVLLAFVIEFWWSYKGIEPQSITASYIFRETQKNISPSKEK